MGRGQGRRPGCGTTAGYAWELRAGQGTCAGCRGAHARRVRQWRRDRGITPRPIAKCGTESGYQKHLRDDTTPCGPCRAANTEAARRRRRGAA